MIHLTIKEQQKTITIKIKEIIIMMPVTSSSMYNTYSLTNVNADTSAPIEVVKPEALLNRTFVLTKVNGDEPAIRRGPAYIKFDENFRFSAKVDNLMGGAATYENGMLKAAKIVSSLMGNSDTEEILKKVLTEGAKVSMNDNTLILQSNEHTLIFE